MLLKLFTLFIVVPLIELTLLLALAEVIKLPTTLLIVIVSGALGAYLARLQGWRTFHRIREELSTGQMPTDSLLDAVLIFFAGALLLTPGVLTDCFGVSLLVPRCRIVYKRWLVRWFNSRFKIQTTGSGESSESASSVVIDSYVVDRHSSGKPSSGEDKTNSS